MVYGVTLTSNIAMSTSDGTIYFASKDLVDDFIEWVKSRYNFINEYHNEKAEAKGSKNIMFYYTSSPFMLSVEKLACKDYKDQSVIYKIYYKDRAAGTYQTAGIDLYPDKSIAESIANTINNNSEAIYCEVTDCVVIESKNSLEILKRFLVNSNTFQDQWKYFSRIAID